MTSSSTQTRVVFALVFLVAGIACAAVGVRSIEPTLARTPSFPEHASDPADIDFEIPPTLGVDPPPQVFAAGKARYVLGFPIVRIAGYRIEPVAGCAATTVKQSGSVLFFRGEDCVVIATPGSTTVIPVPALAELRASNDRVTYRVDGFGLSRIAPSFRPRHVKSHADVTSMLSEMHGAGARALATSREPFLAWVAGGPPVSVVYPLPLGLLQSLKSVRRDPEAPLAKSDTWTDTVDAALVELDVGRAATVPLTFERDDHSCHVAFEVGDVLLGVLAPARGRDDFATFDPIEMGSTCTRTMEAIVPAATPFAELPDAKPLVPAPVELDGTHLSYAHHDVGLVAPGSLFAAFPLDDGVLLRNETGDAFWLDRDGKRQDRAFPRELDYLGVHPLAAGAVALFGLVAFGLALVRFVPRRRDLRRLGASPLRGTFRRFDDALYLEVDGVRYAINDEPHVLGATLGDGAEVLATARVEAPKESYRDASAGTLFRVGNTLWMALALDAEAWESTVAASTGWLVTGAVLFFLPSLYLACALR